jgi:amidase
LTLGVAGAVGLASVARPRVANAAPGAHATPAQFRFDEITVAELQSGMASGRFTAVAITQAYLDRIQAIDRTGPSVNSVIEVNPRRWRLPMPRRRACGRQRSDAWHPDPGSGQHRYCRPHAHDRGRWRWLTARRRDAGLPNCARRGWCSSGRRTCRRPPVDAPISGWSAAPDAQSVCAGSQRLWSAGTGGDQTETDGSIISPSAICGLVGIKPTLGLWSRSGIIPIAASQDTAGPMCRTVADAAALLTVMAGVDARD